MALSSSGCIWVRLLSFKKQMADFDRYVRVRDGNDLKLEFVKPVLWDDDIRKLLEIEPTSSTNSPNHSTWVWTFEKVPPPGEKPHQYDIDFRTIFSERKLSGFEIQERFFAFVPKIYVLGFFRAMGGAHVDMVNRSVQAHWTDAGQKKDEGMVLTKSRVQELLGAPLRATETPDKSTLIYHYKLKTTDGKLKDNMVARIECTFGASGALMQVKGNYQDLNMTLVFDQPK